VIQIHTPRPTDEPSKDGALPLPFVCDGIAQFDVDDIPAFGKAFSDPYYINVIKADEVNFLDTKAKLIRSGGVLRKVVDGGKAAEGTEESFRKAEEEMRRFREEWDVREKQIAEDGKDRKLQ
jgi:EthD domain